MEEAVLIDAVRAPAGRGKPGGGLAATVNRQCGASQQAAFAAHAIMAGAQDMVIAAGVESMSAIPLGTARPSSSGHRIAHRYPAGLVHQGVSAELVADRWKLSRADERNHHRTALTRLEAPA